MVQARAMRAVVFAKELSPQQYEKQPARRAAKPVPFCRDIIANAIPHNIVV